MKVRPSPASCRALVRSRSHRRAAACCVLTMLQSASMLLGDDAMAQTNACDLLKTALAERIEATGVRGYSLEAVPSGAPVPSDAKAIGNCEAGAYKVLYRRWGVTQAAAASSAGSVARPTSTPQAMAVTDEPTRRSAAAQDDQVPVRAAPTTGRPPAAHAPQPASAVAPTPIPVPVVAAASTVAVPTVTPAVLSAPAQEPPAAAGASEAQVGRSVEPAAAKAPPLPPPGASGVPIPLAQQAAAFVAEEWRWIGVLVLLPILAVLWAWRAYRNAYDEAGLPRGPKL